MLVVNAGNVSSLANNVVRKQNYQDNKAAISFKSLNKDVFVKSGQPEQTPEKVLSLKNIISFGAAQTKEKAFEEFREYVGVLMDIYAVQALLGWDTYTGGVPEEGMEAREHQDGTMAVIFQEKLIARKMKRLLEFLKQDQIYPTLGKIDKAMVDRWYKAYTEATKIPTRTVKQNTELYTKSHNAWEKAKEEAKFEIFAPYLEKVIEAKKNEARLLEPDKPVYDTMLDQYEPGTTVKQLDPLFKDLKAEIVPLIKQLSAKMSAEPQKFQFDFMDKKVDGTSVKKFCDRVVKDMGFDFKRGKIANSTHPFTTEISSPDDVRITTEKINDELTLREAIAILGSAMHEAGHALFDQGAARELSRTGLDGGSYGIHESQSRLWEVVVGKSKPFWKHYFPELKKIFPEQLKDVTLEEFYKAINNVEPGLIRVDADEVTYNLHVMLRYELEKEMLYSDKETKDIVKELPEKWNAKMQEYLGIKPPDDAKGVLQDDHWTDGGLGYFPSYTLGNLESVQFYNQAKKDIPDLEEKIAGGNLKVLRNWLADKIHKDGQIYTPGDILKKVTGEPLNAKHFVNYLKDKYSDIYELG